MEFKVITSEEEFLEERDAWTEICSKMPLPSPFQTWEWNYIWWKNNEPVDSLFIIKAYEKKKVYGYAPLTVKDKVAEFIGGRDMDYGRFIVAEKTVAVIEGFVELLLKEKFALRFQEMSARDTQLHVLQKVLEEKKYYLSFRTTRTMQVEPKRYSSFENYLSLLSQSMRSKTIKAGLKKGVSMQEEELTDSLCGEIRSIFENRQDVRGGSAEFEWALTVMKKMEKEGLLGVYVARANDEAIGFLTAMKYRNARFIWLVAFKMEYKDYFPGQLLFYQVIKDAFEKGYDEVDFMRGDYDFKARWECSLDSNYTVCVYRNRFARFKKKFSLKWRPRIKKIVYGNAFLKRLYKKHAK